MGPYGMKVSSRMVIFMDMEKCITKMVNFAMKGVLRIINFVGRELNTMKMEIKSLKVQ